MWLEGDHYSNQNQVFTLFTKMIKLQKLHYIIYYKFTTFILKKII